ncbi:hypothetical protein [Limimaricola hongkongensis]|nr:hypothetical protein [Limimaricola hongkongensis]
MIQLAPTPRAARKRPLLNRIRADWRLRFNTTANTNGAPRASRLLSDEEMAEIELLEREMDAQRERETLSPWAEKRAAFNDRIEAHETRAERLERVVTTVLALILASAGLLWAVDAIWMAVTADPYLMEF